MVTYLLNIERKTKRLPSGTCSVDCSSSVEKANRTPSCTNPKKLPELAISVFFPVPRDAERRAALSRNFSNYKMRMATKCIVPLGATPTYQSSMDLRLLLVLLHFRICRSIAKLLWLSCCPALELAAETCHVCFQEANRTNLQKRKTHERLLQGNSNSICNLLS
jgi:hypothetical protein